MSASSQPFLGAPLTTIFTPPASCSDQTPSVWSLCDESFDIVSCYWSLPTQCYPPSPTIHTWTQGLTYGNKYHWSPGVLPSGLQTLHTQSRGGISSVTGCYMYVQFTRRHLTYLLIFLGTGIYMGMYGAQEARKAYMSCTHGRQLAASPACCLKSPCIGSVRI